MSNSDPVIKNRKGRANVAINYPTVDEVKRAFAEAIPNVEQFDVNRWSLLYRGVMNPAWELADHGIEVMQANGERLVKIRWHFAIDRMNTSSESGLRASAATLRQRLSDLVNIEPASFDDSQSNVVDGLVQEVTCWMRGIIG
jgi:hypothetical protein